MKNKVFCPHCGFMHTINTRERMFINRNGYVSRMCDGCKQLYFFYDNGSWKEKSMAEKDTVKQEDVIKIGEIYSSEDYKIITETEDDHMLFKVLRRSDV